VLADEDKEFSILNNAAVKTARNIE